MNYGLIVGYIFLVTVDLEATGIETESTTAKGITEGGRIDPVVAAAMKSTARDVAEAIEEGIVTDP